MQKPALRKCGHISHYILASKVIIMNFTASAPYRGSDERSQGLQLGLSKEGEEMELS